MPPRLDAFGRIVEQPVDTWEPRSGVALALAHIAPLLSPKSVSHLVSFFVSMGLGDRSPEVRKNMLAAALAAVDLHGKVRHRKCVDSYSADISQMTKHCS